MGEAQELPADNINDLKVENSPENAEKTNKKSSLKHYKWWLQMILYSLFVLAGQSVGTLLGRLYFDNGGKSQWMATLVQVVGFPIMFPFQYFTTPKNHHFDQTNTTNTFHLNLASFYLATGILLAADCMLYSIGLQYLPVTTYTLICASQLAFNALFSYFLNKQNFTPYIVNSLVLLTISSVLLVFQKDPGDANQTTKKKYVIGFLCTLGASAVYALMLSMTQLAFQKIIKKETIRSIVDMTIYQNAIATIVIVIGLFASGDWRRLEGEMREYKLGRVSYVMNLVWTAVSWQAYSVGCVGLVFKVSSLFSNVISIIGLRRRRFWRRVFTGYDDGVEGVAMVLAVWGFVSYMYQHYLDGLKMKEKNSGFSDDDEVGQVALVAERG
ncbi:hypothetical protein DH2020_042154 [Rehmannia glutinosa]|uniref:Probable purine permease n=1 Tax=Rehmannia glutinosa TaxID=99300 RepID=A0ABR0UN21_REHGL